MTRRELFELSAAGLAAGAALEAGPETSSGATRVGVDRPEEPSSMTIRDYLSREARRITDAALRDFPSAEAWHERIPEKRRQFLEMMGLMELAPAERRPMVPVHVTGVLERPEYRIEKLHYESLPNLHVTANLYIPTHTGAPALHPLPAVLYVCGHAENQKVHYQAHARRFAQLGFICLIVETVQLGEAHGFHHGCYREGWFNWYSRGYTPAGVELLNGIRGLDLLAQRQDVDSSRMGVTGISGGGAASWWIAAGDERIRAAAPVCGTTTLESHVSDHIIDGHCDCMWWINTHRWDLADVGGLIAPRPLLIGSADRDPIFTIASIRKVHRQLVRLYETLGAEEKLKLVETPGGHSYHERSRTAIFSWFMKHLAGRNVPPARVGDLDESPAKQESVEALRVYVNGTPSGNRVVTMQNELVPLAEPPLISNADHLDSHRRSVIGALRAQTFTAFPEREAALNLRVEYEFDSGGGNGARFGFTSEPGWRLHGQYWPARDAVGKDHVIVGLRSPAEDRNITESLISRIPVSWARSVVETRGTGDTAWGEELQWHIRRASAWTGRTIASMRVYDALRAMEAVRELTKAKNLTLAARGEMCVVALYAALLDGKAHTLFLESPPASQDLTSHPDGRGPAIEMLNCLRVTDLPVVAGLLHPSEIVIAGDAADTYHWTEELFGRLQPRGRFKRVRDLAEWRAGA